MVYLSDGYLETRKEPIAFKHEKRIKAQKFFELALRLPMDLQMVLCNRAFGVDASIIKKIYSEKGFKEFAKGF